MSTSINLIASIVAFGVLVASFSLLAVFVRSRPAFIFYRISSDLVWINIWTQFLLLTNPIQNETAIFWGLTLLYAIIFYIARPGGIGMTLRGKKAKFGNYTTVLAPKIAIGLWLLGVFSILIFGQGEFIGKQLSNPQLIDQVWIDNQNNIGYDHYQLGSINMVYLYNQQSKQYDTIKADINLDNQVDITLQHTNQGVYEWNINTYTPKTRLIFYIIAPLCILALLGMRRKPDFAPGESDIAISTSRSHMRQFIYGTGGHTMQIVGILLLIPITCGAVVMRDIDERRESYSLCINEQDLPTCSVMAQELQLERGQLINEKTAEILKTYLSLYQGCLRESCPPNQLDMIDSSFAQWLQNQQQVAEKFDQNTKELTYEIAGDSFLYTLDSIPVLADDILLLLNQNTEIDSLMDRFRVQQSLTEQEQAQLKNIILETEHTKLFHSLLWLTERSVYIGDTKLRTANFANSNLQATQLLHLRQISPSVDQHHAFIALNDQTTLSTQEISIHLLTADSIGYITEKNPLFPIWYYLGKGTKMLGWDTISYSLGFIEDYDHIYMEQATKILSRESLDIKAQRTLSQEAITSTRSNQELTLRGKLKTFVQSIGERIQLTIQLMIRNLLSSIDQANRVKQTAQAHTDLLFDLGM